MSILLFVTHSLWSIIDDSGFVVSSVMPSVLSPLSFQQLTGKMGTRPVMGQSQKVECAVPSGGPLRSLRFPERNQRRLRRMNAQAKTGKPFRQHRHELTGVRFQFAPHDEVI